MRRRNQDPTPRTSRRGFLQSAGALSAGALAHATAGGADDNLALLGGPKAVTFPRANQAARWPLFGPDDEKAVLAALRNPGYQPVAALEKDWKDYYKVPYARAHC